jgi:hypothetical protein
MKPITFYPSLALLVISSFAMGGILSKQSIINETLKLCNQKPLECKFKYDILMYNETGRVPYTTPKPLVTKENEKK